MKGLTCALACALLAAAATAPAQEAPAGAAATADRRAPPASPASATPSPAGADERRPLALAATGGLYGLCYGYTYFAWHRHGENTGHLEYRDEGWFGAETYTGGADKLGHFWATYALTRGGAGLLQWGGYDRRSALLSSAGLSTGLFLLAEIEDGYTAKYGFSWNDVAANLAGTAAAVLFELHPRLDEMFDIRVQYFPSRAFLDAAGGREERYNVAEDYTGQTYLLAYHLSSLPAIRDNRWIGWAQYLDLAVGFRAEHYKPRVQGEDRRQKAFLALSLNLQHVLDRLGAPRRGTGEPPGPASTADGLLHFGAEIISLPYTTVEGVKIRRTTP